MNPFEFVPLPQDGPKELPQNVIKTPRYEGYLIYSIKTLTPLHISGKQLNQGVILIQKVFIRVMREK